MAEFPHCDQSVLHAPGVCEYCDLHSEMQQGRIAAKIDFTGEEPNPMGVRDPATLQRPLEKINHWHGNVPMTQAQVKMDESYYRDLEKALEYTLANRFKKVWLKLRRLIHD